MVPLTQLWLPILVGAVLVFVASFVIHMVLTYHRGDVSGVPREDEARAVLGRLQIPPGEYVIPHSATPDAMKSPEFQEKMKQGPVIIMTVRPNGMFNMGSALGVWFVYCLVVAVFAAYIAGRALGPGAHYLDVFRFAGATAFAGFGLAQIQDSIWWARSWTTTAKNLFDALVYAGLTAGALGWLWPG